MARVPYLEPEDLPEEHRHLVARPINLLRALANNPDAMQVFSHIGMWIRHELPLDPRLREMAILQVGYVTASSYEFSHHVKIGKSFGVSDDDIEAIIQESEGQPTSLAPVDRAVLRAARDLTLELELADETWTELEEALGRERLMELVLVIAYYNHVVRVLSALKVDVEEEWSAPLQRYAPPSDVGTWR